MRRFRLLASVTIVALMVVGAVGVTSLLVKNDEVVASAEAQNNFAPDEFSEQALQDMEVALIVWEENYENPVLVLGLKDNPQQQLPILIGEPEARAIELAMDGKKPPRPMTHDLILSVLQAASGEVQRIIVLDVETVLNNETLKDVFTCKMVIDFNGTVKEVDCRPSDAIAVAVRAKVPIFVAQKIIDKYN